ncbi:MAG: complex I subunit 5 family protein [Actinomycetota bacterium]|nr:complex I subunit 5 family protein [Actinomycetota bacterium]
MNELVPLTVAVPLMGAALLVPLTLLRRRRLMDVGAIAAAATCALLCATLLAASTDEGLVHWFGGWQPRSGVALGISFVIDPVSAGLALLAATLTVAAFVFSWRYFEAVGGLYHVLVLVFLAAMVGFSLSGDLFNMFVFFELMSVSAFALTGYKTEESEPLQGALNFGVMNGLGALGILVGVALLYGRTGALNLAQMGETLAGSPGDGLVIVAFTLLVTGFLVKSAMVPFHFWLADAYAVAPAPVCVLFAGVMSELGIYGIARVYWTVFSGSLGGNEGALRGVMLAVGVITALLAAVMCLAQRRLKRMLAFATMSHAGVFVIGAGLLDGEGLAGTFLYVVGDAIVKTAIFFSIGILLHRFGSGDEFNLQGKGRDMRLVGGLFTVAALGVAGLPPFGGFLGKALIEEAAAAAGYGWVLVVVVLSSALTAAALLRVAGRIFGGWGTAEERSDRLERRDEEDEESESTASGERVPAVMIAPLVIFVVAGLASGFVPGIATRALHQAEIFQDREAYASLTLGGDAAAGEEPPVLDTGALRTKGAVGGVISSFIALGVAIASLWSHRLPRPAATTARRLGPVIEGLRRLHSGHVGDYVAWWTFGVALVGGLLAVGLR